MKYITFPPPTYSYEPDSSGLIATKKMKNRNRIDAESCFISIISHMHPQIHEQIDKKAPSISLRDTFQVNFYFLCLIMINIHTLCFDFTCANNNGN